MTLRDAISQLGTLDSEATIWIRSGVPWGPDSEVLVAAEPDHGGSPDRDFEYLVEISIIQELFSRSRLDLDGLAQRVVHYATHDA